VRDHLLCRVLRREEGAEELSPGVGGNRFLKIRCHGDAGFHLYKGEGEDKNLRWEKKSKKGFLYYLVGHPANQQEGEKKNQIKSKKGKETGSTKTRPEKPN